MTEQQPSLRRPVGAYFEGGQRDWAIQALRTYCGSQQGEGALLYSGGWFDRLADRSGPDSFSAADLVAVSMLSVNVPAHAVIRILGTEHQRFSELLGALGPDRPIWEADPADLADGAAADGLWRALRDLDGVGPVIAGKLMAAKRPSLIPVYDKHVHAALGWPPGKFWVAMRSSMIEAHEAVQTATVEAGVDVTALRTVDIVVWMHQHGWPWAEGHLQPPPPFG